MKTKSLGFIGGGRITRIFLHVIKNNRSEYRDIVVYDINADILAALKQQFPVISAAKSPAEAAGQDIVFIALHPPVIMESLEEVTDAVRSDAIVVSLAPKIDLVKMASKLPHVTHLARLIPNATSIVNEGYNPITFSDDFSEVNKHFMLRILRRMGRTFEVPESKLESYAVLSAMLPTYFWFQWKELVELGTEIGLTVEESSNSVRDTLLASIRAYFYSGITPEEVMDLIPVRPIGEHEEQIKAFYREKLLPLFLKIKP